ncbi:MAG: aminodeoxychorismate/anthranilate synthase component II [Alphaproteobacteria bacterium]|nr:aminodeoxychorismate/anthranilate synthase component II [Alphaproteobacteria bacterium]
MFLLIDNYDSFTFNLYQFLLELGAEVKVRRNDSLDAGEALAIGTAGIVLSPGPCTPRESALLVPLVRAAAEARRPLLGICLGHQAVAAALCDVGHDAVVRAPRLLHGKTSEIRHDGAGIFANLPSPFVATRYHSLCVEPGALPAELRVTARSDDDQIMGLEHGEFPVWGVQFHPESIATECGHLLLANFISLAVASQQKN